jgi:hypothetical protein
MLMLTEKNQALDHPLDDQAFARLRSDRSVPFHYRILGRGGNAPRLQRLAPSC